MNEELPRPEQTAPHRRRPRYRGKYPRKFSEKYKEHAASPETVAKVLASGKTPAGTHRPIMVRESLEVLAPKPGEIGVDCTLGYGGHAEAFLPLLKPGGRLIGLDVDPIQLPRTEERLRSLGFDETTLTLRRTNFAGLLQALVSLQIDSVDFILADLGLSSMQIDDPSRGFSVKQSGPLDMRMNPQKGQPASYYARSLAPDALARVLQENADEPRANEIAHAISGRSFQTTSELSETIRRTCPNLKKEDLTLTIRRVFQALRIHVNDEFSALETLLRVMPGCLKAGGRAAILTFHSGEDRRVKKAFEIGLAQGVYRSISTEILRPSAEERYSNPRSAPAKLRFAVRA
jgi:16S rRNA (cytosine1402-N4)-methyltransferase